ncbi:MAG: hypothetical protein ACTSQJ_13480 [Promethearchaeota archaeon]
MEKLKDFYFEIKPIIHSYVFELKQHKKKFLIFIIITLLIFFLTSTLLYSVFPEYSLPDNQTEYFASGLSLLSLIILFASCFFFAGIICTEFSEKTGYVVFPKINKYKLIIGKYFGNLTLVIIFVSIFYIFLAIGGYYYYGGPINFRILRSLGFAVLYILALSSFVTLFSSFMKSENMTIVSTIIILLIVLQIVDQIIQLSNPDLEPLYSLNYLSKLIEYSLYEEFPNPRYEEIDFDDFMYRIWLTPTIESGIIMLILYTIICLSLASILFKRRQL